MKSQILMAVAMLYQNAYADSFIVREFQDGGEIAIQSTLFVDTDSELQSLAKCDKFRVINTRTVGHKEQSSSINIYKQPKHVELKKGFGDSYSGEITGDDDDGSTTVYYLHITYRCIK